VNHGRGLQPLVRKGSSLRAARCGPSDMLWSRSLPEVRTVSRRDLVRGTLEVHTLKGYGAVETGEHLFCDPRVHRVCDETTSGIAKFVTLWQLKDDTWRITRVISYDHVSSHPRTRPQQRPGPGSGGAGLPTMDAITP
jgi:hypothetical protein